jgi:hypothetical protein
MIVLTRISAPPYVRNVIDDFGELAHKVFIPLMPQIYEELHRRVNEFVNDPTQCFDDDRNFPQRSVLGGQYYIGSEQYEGDSADGPFRLRIMVRCLERPRLGQNREGLDYLGLETIVYVNDRGGTFVFDDGFNTSSI